MKVSNRNFVYKVPSFSDYIIFRGIRTRDEKQCNGVSILTLSVIVMSRLEIPIMIHYVVTERADRVLKN